MITGDVTWEARLRRVLLWINWAAAGVGLVLAAVDLGSVPDLFAAAVLAVGYATTVHVAVVRDLDYAPWWPAVAGTAVVVAAVGLTGGATSPFVLLLAAPIYDATIRGGVVPGATAAVVAAGGILAVDAARAGAPALAAPHLQLLMFYALIVVVFSQTRRVLVEEQDLHDRLRAASLVDLERLRRLEASHDLLTSLAELAQVSELNPVSVGRTALRDLARQVPFTAAELRIADAEGDVVVARRGDGLDGTPLHFPVGTAERRVGELRLWADEDLAAYRPTIETMLRPVALAFDNILLLRSIASRAVEEERLRLARELHDDIGPAVASLGLGIDVVALQAAGDDELEAHLGALRATATRIVEDIRRKVEDLRTLRATSLTEALAAAAGAVDAEGPSIVVELVEHRPPRQADMVHVTAIVTEALRNAVAHAAATRITIRGEVDRDRGDVAVVDDGVGFDPDEVPSGHFGLVGMRERAAKIGGTFEVTSGPEGTEVRLRWGPGLSEAA